MLIKTVDSAFLTSIAKIAWKKCIPLNIHISYNYMKYYALLFIYAYYALYMNHDSAYV